MHNPWEQIDLNIYETHMSSESVFQSQTLSSITKEQLNDYVHSKVAILGVAGGNGLEHIDTVNTQKVYGIDVNRQYLDACKTRYPQLNNILEFICCDLNNTDTLLPDSDILICNLIIEYLGENKFVELIRNNKDNLNIVSCVIQRNNKNGFVSNSNLASAFDPILSIHHDIETEKLLNEFSKIGFNCIKKRSYPLPNGKEFIRMDFKENI